MLGSLDLVHFGNGNGVSNSLLQELAEMKEQLRDVMFYFEAQKQIAASELQGEIADGQIVMPEPSAQSKNRRKRR